MNEEIARFLVTLTGPLTPIREVAAKCLDATAKYDKRSKAFLIGHRPKIAPEAYAVELYLGVDDAAMDRYCRIHTKVRFPVSIPEGARAVLRVLNGARIFGGDLFGLPASMRRARPELDRSLRQPLDIATANEIWRIRYKVDAQLFFIGSGSYTYEENAGYFLAPDGHVEVYLPKAKQVAIYTSIGEFIATELRRWEAVYEESLSA